MTTIANVGSAASGEGLRVLSAVGAMKHLAGKKRVKVMLVRPPHHYWPIINESDNFLIPLNYPTIAAWLRHRLDFVDVEILDCCVSEIGYRSLAREIAMRKPDVVGIGEKVCYVNDALRAFEVVKSVNPEIVTIGGSHIFTHEPEWCFRNCSSLDYVIRYEAELAFEKFLKVARDGGGDPGRGSGRGPDALRLRWRGAGATSH